MRFLLRLMLLPVRVVLASVAVGFRVGQMVAGVPDAALARLGRLLGLRAVVALLAGLAIGLLFAPVRDASCANACATLAASRRGGGDAGLAERIAFELQHAPRTWHLPQPVRDGRGGRGDLERAGANRTRRATSWAGSPPPFPVSRGSRT